MYLPLKLTLEVDSRLPVSSSGELQISFRVEFVFFKQLGVFEPSGEHIRLDDLDSERGIDICLLSFR